VQGGFDGLFVMVQESPVSVYSSFAPSSVHVDKHTHTQNREANWVTSQKNFTL